MSVIDLNADVGEEASGPDGDGAVLDSVTSASVACGVHAGDPGVMSATVVAAAARGVVVGAHPSYPDRAGFGRRPMQMDSRLLTDELLAQIGALEAVARGQSVRLRFVKPHGALYNTVADDVAEAEALCAAMSAFGDLVLLVQHGSEAVAVAERRGIAVATEAFADRAYRPDGRLLPRHVPGAVITDTEEVTARAVSLAVEGGVTAVDGSWVTVKAVSICVHGDTAGAAGLAARVRLGLAEAGVSVRPFVA